MRDSRKVIANDTRDKGKTFVYKVASSVAFHIEDISCSIAVPTTNMRGKNEIRLRIYIYSFLFLISYLENTSKRINEFSEFWVAFFWSSVERIIDALQREF